jgi:hypothetical protein
MKKVHDEAEAIKKDRIDIPQEAVVVDNAMSGWTRRLARPQSAALQKLTMEPDKGGVQRGGIFPVQARGVANRGRTWREPPAILRLAREVLGALR